MIELLLALVAAHYLADFPLQGDHIAKNKGKVFFELIGFHCLTAHAFIQACTVAVAAAALGYNWLLPFLAVGVTHWVLDFCKSWQGFDGNLHLTKGARTGPQEYGLWGINIDQALHMAVLLVVALVLVLS